jgi:hypothetical protein
MSRRLLLTDLEPGRLYKVSVRSVASGVASQWGQVVDLLTTSDSSAPKAPTSLSWTVEGTAFKATWTAPTQSEDNTALLDFKDYQVTLFSPADPAVKVIYNTTANRYDFPFESNLAAFGTPRAQVTIEVRSRDNTGNLSVTPVTATVSNPAPATPANVTGTEIIDGVIVKWDSVSAPDLKEYRVYHGTTLVGATNLVWSGRATSFTHANTLYGVDSFYKVVAVDVFNTESVAAGIGPFRPKSSTGVDAVPPAVPAGLAATLTNSSDGQSASAAVSWTAVTDSDNDLAGYRIGYRPVGASDWGYTDVDYTLTSTLIDRLAPYTDYEFRVRSYDFAANFSAWSTTVTATKQANVAPSKPSTPTVSSDTMRIQVFHNNEKASGGPMEADVVRYEVYASTVSAAFTPTSSNQLGYMNAGTVSIATFMIPTTGGGANQTWYVKVVAYDRFGGNSTPSDAATSSPNLIAAANIVDATITNAKIADLAANKITAGTGFVNDLTVKSKFTLGDASTDGIIESYDYGTSSGATGFRLAKSGLIIKTGQIEAAALKIQDSSNLMPPEYAGFEVASASALFATQNLIVGLGSTSPRFGSQNLGTIWGATTADPYIYLGRTTSDYNIDVEPGAQYIVSAYLCVAGAVATTVRTKVKFSDGSIQTVSTENPTPSSVNWIRTSNVITVPAGATKMVVFFDSPTWTANAGFSVDGVQVEKKMGAINTPSAWKPSGLTRIDGGLIRTGEIRSTATTTVNGVVQPNWSINMSGGAQFGDASIRGKLIVGQSGADVDNAQSYISSGNYVAGTTGWKIDSAGAAEFNTGTFRGAIAIGSPRAIAAPTQLAIQDWSTNNTTWSLPTGTYYYKITGYNVGGQTVASNETSIACTNGSFDVPLISWSNLPAGLNGVKIYRGTAPGAENVLVGTVPGTMANDFLDNAYTGTAATPPAVATIANSSQMVGINSDGLFAGSTAFATAPFTVDLAGNLNAPIGVITALDFQTAATGTRISFGAATDNGKISMFSGVSTETKPGFIQAGASGNDITGYTGFVNITGPDVNTYGETPTLSLTGPSPMAINPQSSAVLLADSGTLGPLSWSADAGGVPTINDARGLDVQGRIFGGAAQYTLSLATGWSHYGSGFNSARLYREPNGTFVMTGLIERTGAAVSITTAGVLIGTIPASAYSSTGKELIPCVASQAGSNYCLQVNETGQILLRQISGTAVSMATGQWVSIAGNLVNKFAN